MANFLQNLFWDVFKTSAYYQSIVFLNNKKLQPENFDRQLIDQYIETLRWFLVGANCFRLVLFLISFKFPNICRSFYWYNIAYMALILTMPMDRGNNYGQYIENTLNLHYLLNTYSLWIPWIFSCVL